MKSCCVSPLELIMKRRRHVHSRSGTVFQLVSNLDGNCAIDFIVRSKTSKRPMPFGFW